MRGRLAQRPRLFRALRIGAALAAFAFVVALGALGAARLVPLPEDFFTEGSPVVQFADGSPAHVFLSPDEKWRIAVSRAEIDPSYVRALIALEDSRFYAHPGVDPLAVARATWTNLWQGRVVSGASTLTMQLVRVREPRPRTLRSKLVEAFRALQLEARYDKDTLLAAYLEYVPYGRNIEGVEAASLSYFGHGAAALSVDEIVTLLSVPQNPTHRHPSSANVARLASAREDIARRLLEVGALATGGRADADLLAEVVAAKVPNTLVPFPRMLPHAAMWLRQRYPNRARIKTTLDRGVQQLAERTIEAAHDSSQRHGIHDAALVVVDHATAEVKALVGNFDFWDDARGSQIVGFDVPRSPGSALKPFIYALGVDRGRVLPEFLVEDVPVSYGTYSPKNYDGRFGGLVRMEDALSRSLNVPFVNLLSGLGIDDFVGRMRSWGVSSLSDEPGFYGLSAAIGGLELTPLELAGLYGMLARGGRFRALSVVAPEPDAPPTLELDAFSRGAAFLTQRALRLKDRPDFPARRRFTGVAPEIHWKTGTSYGHRDAWAAGSGARYTAVVWVGNFDNTPSVHLVGSDAAGPILFDVLEGLGRRRGAPAFTPPPDLTAVSVCRYSGRPAAPGCPSTREVLAISRHVPTETCPYHVEVDVERATGLALSPDCRAGRDYETKSFLALPSGVRGWLKGEQRRLPEPPSWAPGCTAGSAGDGPAILSPAPHQVALLIPGVDAERQEIPLAARSASAKLSWFVNGEYLGTVSAEERAWWTPRRGTHEVVVTDEAGRTARRVFTVRDRL